MAVARAEPQLGSRAFAEQEFGVRLRHDAVFAALHEQYGGLDLRQIEPPWATYARSSSIRPSGPAWPASTESAPSEAQAPSSAAQSAAVKIPGSNSKAAACCLRASRPATAERRPPSDAIPAYQSKLSVSGAMAARQTAPITRSGMRAAQARAWGPPPDAPITANLSMPSAFANCSTSAAADATFRPGFGLDPP